MPDDRRRKALRTGRWAERVGAFILRLKGYRIAARDFRCPVGEIDIIARRGSVIAFVEVKARANEEEALNALGARQKRRVERAALAWLAAQGARHDDARAPVMRFDLMIVCPWRWPRHLANAWRSDS